MASRKRAAEFIPPTALTSGKFSSAERKAESQTTSKSSMLAEYYDKICRCDREVQWIVFFLCNLFVTVWQNDETCLHVECGKGNPSVGNFHRMALVERPSVPTFGWNSNCMNDHSPPCKHTTLKDSSLSCRSLAKNELSWNQRYYHSNLSQHLLESVAVSENLWRS